MPFRQGRAGGLLPLGAGATPKLPHLLRAPTVERAPGHPAHSSLHSTLAGVYREASLTVRTNQLDDEVGQEWKERMASMRLLPSELGIPLIYHPCPGNRPARGGIDAAPRTAPCVKASRRTGTPRRRGTLPRTTELPEEPASEFHPLLVEPRPPWADS